MSFLFPWWVLSSCSPLPHSTHSASIFQKGDFTHAWCPGFCGRSPEKCVLIIWIWMYVPGSDGALTIKDPVLRQPSPETRHRLSTRTYSPVFLRKRPIYNTVQGLWDWGQAFWSGILALSESLHVLCPAHHLPKGTYTLTECPNFYKRLPGYTSTLPGSSGQWSLHSQISGDNKAWRRVLK